MQIIILNIAIILIGTIIWWFFISRKTDATSAIIKDGHQHVTVTVSGGYSPETVVFERDVPAAVTFRRKDSSSCLNEVIFPDFGISETLPVGKDFAIEIPTDKPGEYQYSCGMHMFFGKVVVK